MLHSGHLARVSRRQLGRNFPRKTAGKHAEADLDAVSGYLEGIQITEQYFYCFAYRFVKVRYIVHLLRFFR